MDLTKEALDLQEDIYLAQLAEQRVGEDTVSHEELWN